MGCYCLGSPPTQHDLRGVIALAHRLLSMTYGVLLPWLTWPIRVCVGNAREPGHQCHVRREAGAGGRGAGGREGQGGHVGPRAITLDPSPCGGVDVYTGVGVGHPGGGMETKQGLTSWVGNRV